MSVSATLTEVYTTYNGEREGHQVRLDCPLCKTRKLHLSIGDERPILLANCFGGECQGKGAEILDRLGLPLDELSKDEIDELSLGRDAGLPPAEPDVLHAVYSGWLRACPLSDADRAGLRARGLSDDAIARNGYGSWTGRHDAALLPGGDLTVPGVYFAADGKRQVALNDPKYSGILVPVRDREGRVIALKVRLHSPGVDGKMRVFSSIEWGGAKGPYAIHCPKGLPSKCPTVWVVEGELKADVVFAKTGLPVVGVPGVNGSAENLHSLLEALGAKSIGLAFDQDEAGREATRRYAESLGIECVQGVLTWDAAHKGLDDALAADADYSILPFEDWESSRAPRPAPPKTHPGGRSRGRPEAFTVAGLMATEFPPLEWIVPDLLPAGLTLLAGKTKIGKSWLGLDISLSYATGRRLLLSASDAEPPRGGAILLALEDTGRRLKDRIALVLDDTPPPSNLLVFHTGSAWPTQDTKGGLAELGRLLDEHPGTRLVVIDTLHKFQSPKRDKGRGVGYDADYDAMIELHNFATTRNVSILALHHAKKVGEEDPFDDILGTTGCQAPVDTMLVLKKEPGSTNGKFYFKGRDVEEAAYVVRFDAEAFRWVFVGAETERKTPTTALRQILAEGPVSANDGLAQMKANGFTEKQTRTAREALKVVIGRGVTESGKRCNTWALPDTTNKAA